MIRSGFVVLALVVLTLTTGVALAQGQRNRLLGHDWENVEPASAFGERYIHRGTIMGGRMFISGGFNDHDGFLRDVWSSEDGADWRCDTRQAQWSARFSHAMVALDDALYVMGGYNEQGELLSDVWRSSDGAEWILVTESAPWSPRSDFKAIQHQGALFVMGGRGHGVRFSDVWRSTDGLHWELLTNDAWPARSHFGAVSHKGSIVIVGGAYFDYDEAQHIYHSDVWSSVDGRDWTLMTDRAPWRRRYLMELVSVGDYVYAIGGDDKPWYTFIRRDAWITPDGREWMKLRQTERDGQRRRLDFDPRINAVMLAMGETIYLIGGHQYWHGGFRGVDRYGRWRMDNVWKSTGNPPTEFVPEYASEEDDEEDGAGR